jgi:hypothetical protein
VVDIYVYVYPVSWPYLQLATHTQWSIGSFPLSGKKTTIISGVLLSIKWTDGDSSRVLI